MTVRSVPQSCSLHLLSLGLSLFSGSDQSRFRGFFRHQLGIVTQARCHVSQARRVGLKIQCLLRGGADIGASTPAITVPFLSTLTNYHSDEMPGSGPAPGWGAE